MVALIITLLIVSAVIAILIIGSNKNNTNPDYENWKRKTSKNDNSNYDKAKREAILFEADSRLRIINESLQLMEKTKNINTLKGRYDTVCEHITWCIENEIELSNKPAKEAKLLIDNLFDQQLKRINDIK